MYLVNEKYYRRSVVYIINSSVVRPVPLNPLVIFVFDWPLAFGAIGSNNLSTHFLFYCNRASYKKKSKASSFVMMLVAVSSSQHSDDTISSGCI